ncbi:MAG: ABC transporter substrate-binding protein, partial [Pseudomonadota bacterium]
MMTRSLHSNTSRLRPLTVLFLGLAFLMLSAFPVQAKELKFGVPAWPGLTVKTEVATQLLES